MLPKLISGWNQDGAADEAFQARWNRMTDDEKRAQIAAARRVVASHIAPIAAQVASPEYRNTLPALEDEFRRNSRWYAKIFCGDDLVAVVRATTEAKCARETQNALHRLKYPHTTLLRLRALAANARRRSKAITEERIAAQATEHRRMEWQEEI